LKPFVDLIEDLLLNILIVDQNEEVIIQSLHSINFLVVALHV